MVEAAIKSEEFNKSVAQDRATMIRESAKKKGSKDVSDLVGIATGKGTKKILDKFFLNANNVIWGSAITFIPLFGLTLLMSLGLVLLLFLKRLFAASLEDKGFDVKISLWVMIYTWGTLLAQLILTVVIYAMIYILVNPVGVGLDALGL